MSHTCSQVSADTRAQWKHSHHKSNAERTTWEFSRGREERTSSQLQGHAHPRCCHTHWAEGSPFSLTQTLKTFLVSFLEAELLKACNTNKPTIVALMDGYFFHCFSCCWYNRREMIEYSMNRWGGGRGGGLLVMAGGGLRVGMAVTDARLVSARLARAGRSRDREQRGERSDPVPGCILPSSNQRARSGWLTLPLAIPITQSLLLCFQPWFMCYLLTLHSILDDRETGGSEKTVTPEFHYRDTWLHWETIKCGLSKSSTK